MDEMFAPPPNRKERAVIPQGLQPPMCLCGTDCQFVRDLRFGDSYGMRLWMCANYEYDPPHKTMPYFSDGTQQTPPPLCEFMNYVDQEQSKEDAEIMMSKARAKASLFRMECEWEEQSRRERIEEAEKEERRVKKQEERRQWLEECRRKNEEEERLARDARETERERMRERARRAREAGPDALRKGKYPRCTQ